MSRSAGDAQARQVVTGGARPLLAERQVVLDGAALVAVTLDRDARPSRWPWSHCACFSSVARASSVSAACRTRSGCRRAGRPRPRASAARMSAAPRRPRCRSGARRALPRRARRAAGRPAGRGAGASSPARGGERGRALAGRSRRRGRRPRARETRRQTAELANGMKPPRMVLVTGPSRAGRCCPAPWPGSGMSGRRGRRS